MNQITTSGNDHILRKDATARLSAMRYGNVKVMGEHILDQNEMREAEDEEQLFQRAAERRKRRGGGPGNAGVEEEAEENESLFSRHLRLARAREDE